ncbi:MAG TPA: polysaccharide deacetylase family protein [Casimicrobiaceae bacterium]|nr:polysaccharide deacetylase family protein [Casimicrobiaceae bacterium]
MKLALKVDVATLKGTRVGVPALVDVLQRQGVNATFFFTFGPDPGSRVLRRVWPAMDIGRRARATLSSVAEAGFETGVRGHDASRWIAEVAEADATWTAAAMQRAIDRYRDAFGEAPRTHAAAAWQMSRHALRFSQRLGFDYASDGRGVGPHLPVWNGELVRCVQLPTTLPTLDELASAWHVADEGLANEMLAFTAQSSGDHVFSLRAEVEGIAMLATFEQLVMGWKAQGYEVVALRTLYESLDSATLPRSEVGIGTVPGRRETLFVQGNEFLADVAIPHDVLEEVT